MTSPSVQTQSRRLAGVEKIWYATLTLAQEFDQTAGEPPDDGLTKLLTNPWDTLGADAELPTDQPVTMLFLNPKEDGGEFNTTLIAEGITGTTFITVREEQQAETMDMAMAMRSAKPEPIYFQNLETKEQPIEVVEVGKLAYAHYHLSEEESKRVAFRYAICRAPKYMATFLNEQAERRGMTIRFSTIDDGTFRVIYQTEGAKPGDVVALGPGGGTGLPCIKLTGTMVNGVFVIDSMMMVPYRTPPAP